MKYEVLVRHAQNIEEGQVSYWYDRTLIDADGEEEALIEALARLHSCNDAVTTVHEQASGRENPYSVDTGSVLYPCDCTMPSAVMRARMEWDLERN